MDRISDRRWWLKEIRYIIFLPETSIPKGGCDPSAMEMHPGMPIPV